MKAHKENDPSGVAFYLKPGDTLNVTGKGACEITPDGDLRSIFNTKEHDGQISSCSIDVKLALQAALSACSGHPSKKLELIASKSPASKKFKSQDVREMNIKVEKEGLDEDT